MNLSKSFILAIIAIVPVSVIAQPAVHDSSGVILQGGDNISNAFYIAAIPFSDGGTTIGFTDDYDGSCGGGSGGAPDVVYAFEPQAEMNIHISLCRSSDFDTRLYVFDEGMNEIACNDDACTNQYSQYVSELPNVNLSAGQTYYIIVDGYGMNYGNYNLELLECYPSITEMGWVINGLSEPIPGATVWIIGTDGQSIAHDTTDASGYFGFWTPIDGNFWIKVAKTGFVTQIQGPFQFSGCNAVIVDFVLEALSCDISPAPDAIIEDEQICYDDYEDIYNIGCSEIIWDTIPNNCTVWGTSGTYSLNGNDSRDADWFEFDLHDSSAVRLEGMAEFDALMMLIKQGPEIPCQGFSVINYVSSMACTEMIMDSDLGVGRYWVWCGPSDFSGVDCGSSYQFTLTSIALSQCDYVIGDINGNGSMNGIDVTYGVTYFKGGFPPPYSCYCGGQSWYVSGDVNGDCVFNGMDIVYIVNYLKGGPPWMPCPACPPSR